MACLDTELAHANQRGLAVVAALGDLAEFQVLQPDAPFEADREKRVEQQVAVEVERLPPLIARDPDDAVAHVVIHAEDVGVLVVHEVVGEPPVLGRPAHVPLPRRGVNLGIVHPVPLAVHDVVADLHVLDDLGHAQCHGARPPRRSARAGGQHQSASHLESPLRGDGAMDVASSRARRGSLRCPGGSRRARTARLSMSASVRCANAGTSVIAMVFASFHYLRYRNLRLRRLPVSKGYTSSTQSPDAAEIHVCMRLPGSCSTPVRRSRTWPSTSSTTHD